VQSVYPTKNRFPSFYLLTGESWNGLVMPAKTPKAAIDRFYTALAQVLQTSDVRERIVALGAEVSGIAPAEFASFMEKETQKWARVVREANIKAE
jgi:tripartite-type tricarboxylate transporter receptor subunit TctC